MKVKTGLRLGMLAALYGVAGCSMIQKPCQDPNSCNCPTNSNPACTPFPDDNGDNPSTMAKKNHDGGTDR